MPSCAYCANKPCYKGTPETVPTDCPGHDHTSEELFSLYSAPEREEANRAALVEAENYCRASRVEEIMDYAYKCGYHKLGVAFCIGLSAEAQIFCDILRSNGFTVESVCCKNGSIPKSEIGVTQPEQTHPDWPYEAMCDPIGQALALDEAGCELSILLGLCVGHDTLVLRHSKAPCTVLAVKDRVTGHNPLAVIYTVKGYHKSVFHFIENKYGK